jgi:hypothetical protein
MTSEGQSKWRDALAALGLVYRRGGEPGPDAPRASRYDRGAFVSPRLDQDIDELRARLAALEQRFASD